MQKHDVITHQFGRYPNKIGVLRNQFIICLAAAGVLCLAPTFLQAGKGQPSASTATPDISIKAGSDRSSSTADALGVQFIDGSSSSIMLNRNGKNYVVDLISRTIREVESSKPVPDPQLREIALVDATPKSTQQGAKIFAEKCSTCHGRDGKGVKALGTPDLTSPKVQASLTRETIINTIKQGKKGTLMPAWEGKLSNDEIFAVGSFVKSLGSGDSAPQRAAATAAKVNARIYTPADDYLFSLPTGRRLDRHGLYVNFTHRFAFDTAFSGKARGAILDGLDGFSISSFGFQYGITDKLSVSAYRSPSVIGRPIELMTAYHILDEHDGYPLNATFRFSVDGQNNFSKNFTTNFEGIFSRSLFNRTQVYVVPTLSLQNRRLIADPILEDPPPDLPGVNSFSLGLGGAFDIRPTVAVIAEVIPTLVNGRALGIHRPAYAFGIQKRLWRHAFTLGFSTSPGTVVSQRAGTRATLLGDPSADTPSGLFIGFDLMRQMY